MGKERRALKRIIGAIPGAAYEGGLAAIEASPTAKFGLTFLNRLLKASQGKSNTELATAAAEAGRATDEQLLSLLNEIGGVTRRNEDAALQISRAFFDLLAKRKGELASIGEIKESLSRLHSLPADVREALSGDFDDIKFGIAGLGDRLGRIERLVKQSDIDGLDKDAEEFECKYFEFISENFNRMRFFGVRDLRGVRQELSIAYVPLRLRSRNGGDDTGYGSAGDILLAEPLITIRGPAGCGKTTLMHWIGLQCCDRDRAGNPWAGCVPFLVPLREISDGRPDATKLVDYTADPGAFLKRPPKGWLAKLLDKGRAVVMFDGVDELDAKRRPAFWDWIEEFAGIHTKPGNRFIVTSRPFPDRDEQGGEARHLWAPPKGFVLGEVEDMTDGDIKQFIASWRAAVLELEKDDLERTSLETARDRLPEALKEPANRRVRELCRTPLLCAMVCALHWREEGYLPAKRTDLYDKCCVMLIEERDRKRDIKPPEPPLSYLTLDDKEMILQRLALDMMRNKGGDSERDYHIEITREEASNWIKSSLSSVGDERARKCDAAAVIDFLIERTGLLREPGTGKVDFPHRTFQEYLAACAAGAGWHAGDLAARAGEDQWRETIVLAAGTKAGGVAFGRELISELLKKGRAVRKRATKKAYLALAIACLETARQLDQDLREKVLGHLKDILPPENEEEARAVAAAGGVVVARLAYGKWKRRKVSAVAACVRALSLIGGEQATALLTAEDGYFGDKRKTVLEALCRCPEVNPLSIPSVLASVSDGGAVPDFARPHVSDLTPLSGLTALQFLNLNSTQVTDLTPLSGLTALQYLYLHDTHVTDLTPLSGLTALQTLDLNSTQVTDLTPLSGLTALQRLDLGATRVTDLAPLSGLTALQTLDLNSTQVTDLTPLARLTALQYLYLISTPVTDLTPLAGLTTLQYLDLDSTKVTDLTPLAGLTALQTLDVRTTQVTDLTPLAGLTALQHFSLSATQVTDLTPLSGLTALQLLYLHDTQVTDLTPVEQISGLKIRR